jgi:hypothetical protein
LFEETSQSDSFEIWDDRHPQTAGGTAALQRLTRHVDHGSPEFVGHHPGGLVSSQGQLT